MGVRHVSTDFNLAGQLVGQTLAEAFRKFVLNDPEVNALGKVAIEAEPVCRSVFEDAWFGS